MLYFSHFSSSNIYYFHYCFQNLAKDASLDSPQSHNSLFFSISYTWAAIWQNISTVLNAISLTNLKVGHTDLIFISSVSSLKIKWNWCIIHPNRLTRTALKTLFFLFFLTLLIDAAYASVYYCYSSNFFTNLQFFYASFLKA